MVDAYIIDAVRTPSGRRNGGLSHVHPADLGAHVITSLLDRTDIPPADIDPERFRHPFDGDGFRKHIFDGELNQFTAAELVAETWNVQRDELDEFALRSHRRAALATDEGRFEGELVPYGAAVADEGIR